MMIEKTDLCKSNPEKLSTKKVEHIPSAFSMFSISSFKDIGNKHDAYIKTAKVVRL